MTSIPQQRHAQRPSLPEASATTSIGTDSRGEYEVKKAESRGKMACAGRGVQTPCVHGPHLFCSPFNPLHTPWPATEKVFGRCLSLLVNEWVKMEEYSTQRTQWNQRPKYVENRAFLLSGNISSAGARDVCSCDKWNDQIGWAKWEIAVCNMKRRLVYLRGNRELWSWGQPREFCPSRSFLWQDCEGDRVWT